MNDTLRGGVVATMRPVDPEELPTSYAWDFPYPLSVQAVDVRRLDHVEELLLLDEAGHILAVLLLPLPEPREPSWTWA